jgi:hypothetical protein
MVRDDKDLVDVVVQQYQMSAMCESNESFVAVQTLILEIFAKNVSTVIRVNWKNIIIDLKNKLCFRVERIVVNSTAASP